MSFYASYPVTSGGVPIYANLAAFPSVATEGALGVAADTGNIYEYHLGAWVLVAGPSFVYTTGNLTDAGTDGIVITGGTNAVIGSGTSIAQHVADTTHNGYLSSTDWNTFNSKQAALTIGNLTDAGTDGIVVTGGTGSVIGAGTSIAQHVADASHNGYLSSTDWSTFNSKQSALTIGNLTDAGTDGITVTGGTGSVIGSGTSLSQHVADASHNGYLSSADWSTFNSKQSALTIGNLTDAGTDGIVITGGTGSIIGSGTSIAQHVADTTHNGYLSSTDWNTFNSKQAALTIGNFTDAGTDGITVTGGTGAIIGSGTSIAQHVADTTHNGYLSSTDWNTFNGKGAGSVTSVAMTVPSFLSISGSPITTSGTLAVSLSGTALPVANGGTGLTSGTSGGVLYYSASGTLASSGALTENTLVLGGGAGAAPTSLGAGTTTTVLHGNASGAPTYAAVSLTADITGTLAIGNGGTGQTTKAAAFDALSPMTTGGDIIYGGTSGTGTRLANGSAGQVLTSNGTTTAPSWQTAASSPTSNYWSGYTQNTATWTTSSNTFADGSNSGGNAITKRQGNLTVTAAASNVAGITFTPAASSSVYLVTATSNFGAAASGNTAVAALTDGSNTIIGTTQNQWVIAVPNGLSGFTITSIFVPGTGSAVTLKLRIACPQSASMTLGSNVSTTGTGAIEWCIVQIV